jgi:hypothetical protein
MATDPSLNSFAAVVVNPTHCCSGRRFHSLFSQTSQPQDAGFYHDSHDSMKQISTHIWLTTVATRVLGCLVIHNFFTLLKRRSLSRLVSTQTITLLSD